MERKNNEQSRIEKLRGLLFFSSNKCNIVISSNIFNGNKA